MHTEFSMKTTTHFILLLLAVSLVCVSLAGAQVQKLAQTGMKFLNVEPDPRAAALGGAFTAIEGASTATFFNPAGTARMPALANFFVGYAQWIADINHVFASLSISPLQGDYGVATLS